MKTILVVEDDDFLSSVITGELASAGYQVFSAVDGMQGVETARAKQPDLILMDILMPKMNGYEATALLKSGDDTKHIPVVILSNLGQPEEVEQARAAGAEDFLVKVNYTPKDIIEKVKRYVPDEVSTA